MGRQKKEETMRVMTVRIPDSLYNSIQKNAKDVGVKMAPYIRTCLHLCVCGAINNNKTRR